MASSDPNTPQSCGGRPFPSPPEGEGEGEGRSPGLEGEAGSSGGGREGAPCRPHGWEESGGPQSPPSMEDSGSCGSSPLGGRRSPWLPPEEEEEEEEDSWRAPNGDLQGPPWEYWSPELGCRSSSCEPPRKKARSPPAGEWWKDPLSPSGGKGWTSNDPQIQPGDPSSGLTTVSGSDPAGDSDSPRDPSDSPAGLDSPQRESRQRSRESPGPGKHARGTWFPHAEVAGYWKGCQCVLKKNLRDEFLSACPEPCVPDGTARPPPTNQSVFKLLTETHARIVYDSTNYTFNTQKGVLDMLGPALAIYEMATAAIEAQGEVDPQAVRQLTRSLLSYAGNANHRLKRQRCSSVLEAINPQLATFTARMTGQNLDGLLFPEDKVSILKAAIRSLPALPEEPPEMDLDQQPQAQDETCLDLWHRRFGHADPSAIFRLYHGRLARGIEINTTEAKRMPKCMTCLFVRGDQPLSSLNAVRSSAALRDVIHCELSEPFNVPSLTLRRYLFVLVDDFSRFCVAYLLQETGEMHGCFEKYLAMLSKKNKLHPKLFQMNSAADAVSPQTLAYLERRGIAHKRGVKPILGPGGTAEREVGCLLEMTRCMLADAMLPDHFWGHALMTATYLWNRLPIGRKKSTPSRVWYGKVPSVKHLRVFGSLVRNGPEPHDGAQRIFVGYSACKIGYQFMNLETGVVLADPALDFDERKMVRKRGNILDTIERECYGVSPEPHRALAGFKTRNEAYTPGERDGYVEDEEPVEPSMPHWGPPSAICHPSQFARSFPEDNVRAAIRSFPALPEKPPEINFGNCRGASRPPFIASPLGFPPPPPFQAGPLPMYEPCPDPRPQDETSLELWHRRFGHADSATILRLQKGPLATGIEIKATEAERAARCVTCLAVKGEPPSLPLSAEKSSTALTDLIHCELYGPVKVPSLTRRYALIFVDDFSRFCVTYLLQGTGEMHECFDKYLAMLSKKRKSSPKSFQMNSVADAITPQTQRFLERRGVAHKRGGTAEREKGCLLEMTRCMLADAMLPSQFWGHAILAATYLWNRLATKRKKRTPFQAWHGKVPSVKHLRVFGSLVHDRLEPSRHAQHIFVGYDSCKLGYRFMNLETSLVLAKHTLDFDERKGVEKRGNVLDTFERQGYDMSPWQGLRGRPAVCEARHEVYAPGDGYESMDLEDEEPVEPSMPHWGPPSAIGHPSQFARSFPEDNVRAAVRSFPALPEEPPEINFGNCRGASRPPFIASPLGFPPPPPFQAGPLPMYKPCPGQLPQIQDETSLELWHRRFGHANSAAILWLQYGKRATGMRINATEAERFATCATCQEVKGDTPPPSASAVRRSPALMDLIHCELYGPSDVPAVTLERYVLIFVDDFSRYCVAYLLKETGQMHEYFVKYLALVNKRHGRQPEAFQMNSAADSISPLTQAFLEGHGIAQKSGVKAVLGPSGTAEQEVGSLLEMSRCMVADAMLPDRFWGHAFMTATYLWNRLPNKRKKRTPFHVWHGKVPSLKRLRVFGSLARHQQEPPGPTQHIFVGYSTLGFGTREAGYRFMNLDTGLVRAKRTLDFDERKGVEKKGSFLHVLEKLGCAMSPQLESRRTLAGDAAQDESIAPGDGYESMDLESDGSVEDSVPHSALAPATGHASQLETSFLKDNPASGQDFEGIPREEAQSFPPPPPPPLSSWH